MPRGGIRLCRDAEGQTSDVSRAAQRVGYRFGGDGSRREQYRARACKAAKLTEQQFVPVGFDPRITAALRPDSVFVPIEQLGACIAFNSLAQNIAKQGRDEITRQDRDQPNGLLGSR